MSRARGSREIEPADSADADWEEEAWQEDAQWRGPGVRWWWPWAAFVLSLAGFGVSLYLTVEHFSGAIPNCPNTGIISCLKVTTSPESEVFGVFPVALLGLLFYTAQVGINLPILWRQGGEWGRRIAWARLVLAVTGIGFVFYLVYSELFSIKAICLWCTGVHVITLVLFVLVVATFPTMVSLSGAEPD
jgi:uncharacterized membrane protein